MPDACLIADHVAGIIEGGTVEEYGAKALTAGGWYSIQQPYFDGGMFIDPPAIPMSASPAAAVTELATVGRM